MTSDQRDLVFTTIKDNLSAFRGSKAIIFLAIAFKMDARREMHLTHYSKLSKRTGYSIAACRKVVDDLCATRIHGLPVLQKTGLGRSGSSFYILPCWDSEVAEALRGLTEPAQAAASRILREQGGN